MIRKANINDLETIVLYNKLMAYETEKLVLEEDILTQCVRNALTDEGKAIYWVYECDEQVVGQLMITKEWSDWRNGEIWWIQSVYVNEKYRRRKIFNSLYSHVKSEVENNVNIVGLRLYVEKDNKIAQNTYSDMGMKETHYRLFEWIRN